MTYLGVLFVVGKLPPKHGCGRLSPSVSKQRDTLDHTYMKLLKVMVEMAPVNAADTLSSYARQEFSSEASQHIFPITLHHLRLLVLFQRDIDADIKYDKCIWCKPGQAKKKKHALVDCPTARPLPTDRTLLSDEAFNAGQQDAAVAYIHYAQLRHHPRANGATAFMAGLPLAQMGTYVVPVPAAPTALPTLPPVVNTYTPSSVVPPPPAALSGPLPSIVQLAPTAMPPPASITRTACATNIGAADETVSATLAADMQSLTITNANTALDALPSSEASGVGSQADQDVGQIVVNRQSTTFGPTPTASVVPSVNLQDSAAINFTEAAPSCPAPAASGHVASNPVSVNGDLRKRLSNLKGRAKYPLRHSLRTGPAKGQVVTNYFIMTFDPKTIFYKYHLIGIPVSESRAGKKRYMETIIQNVPFLNTNRTLFATDNAATIISWVNLHQYATGVRVATGDPVTGVGGAWRLLDIVDRNTTTRLTLQYSGQVDIAGLQSYANTTHPNTATYDPSPAETALNTIIATCITSNNTLHLNNHNFYVRDAFRDLRTSENNAIAPLRSLRGYSYRVHATMGNVLLNVSPANSAFWRPLLVNEVSATWLRTFRWRCRRCEASTQECQGLHQLRSQQQGSEVQAQEMWRRQLHSG